MRAAGGERPVLRAIRGDASDEELAALLVVLAAAAGSGPAQPGPPRRSAWADRAAQVRAPRQPGPGAWQASAWPR